MARFIGKELSAANQTAHSLNGTLSNPIRNLKSLPWGETLQVSAMVIAAMLLMEWLIVALSHQLAGDSSPAFAWLTPRTQLLLNLLGGGITGWATTELWLYRQRSQYLQPAIVWTLVGSSVIVLSLRWLLEQLLATRLLPPAILTDLTSALLMCLILGGFWRFWRDRLRR